jgi:hypothetical protein
MKRLTTSQVGRASRPSCLTFVMCMLSVSACAPEVRTPTVNQPPIAVLTAPDSARVGERVLIDANQSIDVDGTVDESFMVFGDGSDPQAIFIVEHVFEEPGAFLLELFIHDDAGATARARKRIVVDE